MNNKIRGISLAFCGGLGWGWSGPILLSQESLLLSSQSALHFHISHALFDGTERRGKDEWCIGWMKG